MTNVSFIFSFTGTTETTSTHHSPGSCTCPYSSSYAYAYAYGDATTRSTPAYLRRTIHDQTSEVHATGPEAGTQYHLLKWRQRLLSAQSSETSL